MAAVPVQASVFDDDLRQESNHSLNIRQFLRELPLEDIEESETIKNYINSEILYSDDSFAKATWTKAF